MSAPLQHEKAITRDEHARHQRAKFAPIVGLVQSLASEVVLEIPNIVAVMIWQRTASSEHTLRCVYSSDSDNYLQDWDLLRSADNLNSIGLEAISRRKGTARPWRSFVTNQAHPVQLRDSCAATNLNTLWCCHLDVDWTSDGYIVTVFAKRESIGPPLPERLVSLSESLVAFLHVALEAESQIRAAGVNADAPVAGSGDEPIASFRRLTESPIWTLPQIEETVLRRIRATIPDLRELHLFLTNPLDSHLYYAATDQLRILPRSDQISATKWTLSTLDQVYTRHVEHRLRELAHQTDRPAGTLVAFYRRIQEQGLRADELKGHAGLLRLVLRCLPQELSCGVVGAAVREGILKVGGKDYWNFSQWKHRKKRPFFYQKLQVEKLFGVAKDGYLTAAPVYDAGQIIGGLFFVTPDRPDQEQMSVLLDGRLHASQLLSQYRTTQFTRSVIDTLEHEPQAKFQSVVERHLGQLLLYGLLAVVDNSQGSPHVTHAWYRAHGAIQCEPHGSQEVRQSRLLKTLFVRMKERREWLMELDRDEWLSSNLRDIFRDAHSCVLFPFDKDVDFLFAVSEPVDRLLNSLSSLQQKLASLQTVVQLRDTYARRHEVQRFHSNATFSWHNLSRRFSRPLYDIYNRMRARIAKLQTSEPAVDELRQLVDELGVIQAIMESQFLALKDSVDAHDATDNNVESINIQNIMETELKDYFALLLRTRDREVAIPYTGKVQLTINCPRGIHVRGHVHAFKMAMLSLLENTLKDYAISKDLVAQGDSARLSVQIDTQRTDGVVSICVSDNGEGMDESQIKAHNARFEAISKGSIVGYQGFDKRIASSKGSGSQIGLLHAATVFAGMRSADGKNGGQIRVTANKPFGTTFKISIPTS